MFGNSFSLAVAVLLAGILGWLAFYFMDRHWYHRLLLGSVFHTVDNIEARHTDFAEIALLTRIGRESAIPVGNLSKNIGSRTHRLEIHSSEKIDLFYSAGLLFLMILTVLVLASSVAPTGSGVTPNSGSAPASESPLKTVNERDSSLQLPSGEHK